MQLHTLMPDRSRGWIATASAVTCLAGGAQAQAFNLDVGESATVGVPQNTYGAAANQVGDWMALDGGPPYLFTLTDVNGVLTNVQSECVASGGTGDYYDNNAITQGDDERLVDDAQDVGSGASISTWIFSNLQDGPYEVYTYAFGPDDFTYRTRVAPEGSSDEQFIGGIFPGGHALGVSYARHCVDVTGGELRMEIEAAVGFASCNGFQIVPASSVCDPEPGVPVCDCSAMGSGPCGNDGDPGHGCANSAGSAGARLNADGMTDPDDIVLMIAGAPANQPGLFFQGAVLLNGGAGAFFGDGLRCASDSIKRLQIRATDGAGVTSTSVSISSAGGVGPGSGARFYQFWYRDPNGSACGAGFNLSNAYEIIW